MRKSIFVIVLTLLIQIICTESQAEKSPQNHQDSNLNESSENTETVEEQEQPKKIDRREIIKTPKDFGYTLPHEGNERQRTEFQGKRGEEKPFSLKILAPNDHIGKTMERYPQFWIQVAPIPKTPLQYNVMLNGTSLWQGTLIPKSNLLSLKVPERLPPLSPGIYVLAVGHGCPQDCYVARIAFEVVEKDKMLAEKVSQAIDLEKKIKLLAEGGYWFEAQSYIVEMGAKN